MTAIVPYAELPNRVRLHYREHGDPSDPALVLIAPAGSDQQAFAFQVDELAGVYRTIVFDSRATGLTEYPSSDFTIADLANDVVRLLDHLDIARAAVVGTSMGGCVALELALAAPDRVWALVLASTTGGGRLSSRTHDDRLEAIRTAAALPPGQRGKRLARLYYGPRAYDGDPEAYRSIVERAGWDADRPIEPDRHPHNRALRDFDVSKRVARIDVPVLVLHGDDDIIVPPTDASRLAEAIRGASYAVLPGGHLFFMQSAHRFNETVIDFLDAYRTKVTGPAGHAR